MHLYLPHSIPTIMCQLNIFHTDRTHRSMWPDVSSRWQRSTSDSNALSDRTHSRVWSGVTGHVWSVKTFSGTSLFHLHGRPDALHRVRSVVHRVRLQTLAGLTVDSATCASSQVLTNVRSLELMLQPSNTLTGWVWSSKGPRPVKQYCHKPLQIATRLERNLF
jgi:hypothetical protein